MIPCWLVASSWIEYPEVDGKPVRTELALPDRSPFLLAGVCETRPTGRQMAMQMQEPPPRPVHIGERLPLPYGFDVLGSQQPVQIMEQMVVVWACTAPCVSLSSFR